MSTPLDRFRLRIPCLVGADPSRAGGDNVLTAGVPAFWRGNDLQIEVGLLDAAGVAIITDVSGIDSITVEVKSKQGDDAVTLMSKTVAAASITQDLEQADWDDDEGQHAVAVFSNAEANLDLAGKNKGSFWLVVSYLTTASPAKLITVYGGPIDVYEDATPDSGPISGGNLVVVDSMYSSGGVFLLEGLTEGKVYSWTKGSDDTNLVNGTETLTATGLFTAQGTSATLNGTPDAGVSAIVRGEVFLTADQNDARYAAAGSGGFWTEANRVLTFEDLTGDLGLVLSGAADKAAAIKFVFGTTAKFLLSGDDDTKDYRFSFEDADAVSFYFQNLGEIGGSLLILTPAGASGQVTIGGDLGYMVAPTTPPSITSADTLVYCIGGGPTYYLGQPTGWLKVWVNTQQCCIPYYYSASC